MTAASSPEPVPVYVRTGNWADDANCLGMNPDIFFPTRGEDVRYAQSICRACDVQVECAHYALNQNDTLQGIWGGLTQRDRRRIRRGRAATRSRQRSTDQGVA